tara:strand:- start:7925 stop:11482 length:3558 start_codon:yes stop_codon:yes gene_type:complete
MATHRKKLSLVLLFLGALVLGASVGTGCAIQRGERSVVQPLALSKTQFQGEWYYQKTITEAPYDAPGVFIGSTSTGYKIRWEITERYLYAFTTQPNVRNADSTVAPVAAWPIIGHFTIRHRINYSTGQPSNVVSEDYIDKPWYQRPHFRVAWERSFITDFSSSFWIYRMFGYVVGERPVNVRPEKVRMLKDYMDFVTEEVISPGVGALIGKLNTSMPVSAYRIKYRHSFRKVGKSTYTPQPMSDDQFEKFGFFRTAIINNHIDRGLVDWSYQYYANRHNVATQAELDKYEADKTPEADRKPKQIVYYLSPDFPEKYKDTAHLIMEDWNKAFQNALGRKDQVVVLHENDFGLPEGQKREIGDIRYKFLYWVAKPISMGLLGYGPSFADYDTGEIISSAAYVYGAVVDRVVNRFMLYYDMVKGTYTDEELRNGKDYLDIINNFGNSTNGTSQPLTAKNGVKIMPPAYKGFDIQKAHNYVHTAEFKHKTQLLKKLDRTAIQARMSMLDNKPHLQWAMMSDDMLRGLFPQTEPAALRQSNSDTARNILESYFNPAKLTRITGLRKLMNDADEFSKHNAMLANYVDPALQKFVVANKNLSRSELADKMARMIFRGTEAHEIGHTLGLRHNFSASADEPNYFPEYFELQKKQGGNTPGDDKDNRHSWFYMYSSIMDYHGEVYGDAVGIGSYDYAAIRYGYAGKLELDNTDDLTQYVKKVASAFKTTEYYKDLYTELKIEESALKTSKGLDGQTIFDANQSLLKVTGVKADGSTTLIMNLTADDLSGRRALQRIKAMFNIIPQDARLFADGYLFIDDGKTPLKRRFYRFCSDELVGQNPYCNRFDSGSNPRQIVDNMIRRYDGVYPLVNWSRGRRYFRLGYGYLSYLIGRFRVVNDFYQNWMFRVINEANFDGSAEYYNQLAAISKGLGFISRVIHTPEPGNHVLDTDQNMYVASPTKTANNINIPIGIGRYFYSRLQQDELGLAMYRFDRIGTMYDKYVAMMTLGIRDWGLVRNRLNFFYVNFLDYFSRDDVTDMFTGSISGIFEKKFAMTHDDKMIAPNFHPVLQYFSMYMAMTMLNSGFFGNTFTHYMTVAAVGSGDSWTPPPGAKTISFSNTSNTMTYFAVQTRDNKSIAYKLVKLGNDYSTKLKELRAAQPTSAVNNVKIKELESKLQWVETVINMMKLYVDTYFEG